MKLFEGPRSSTVISVASQRFSGSECSLSASIRFSSRVLSNCDASAAITLSKTIWFDHVT